jgi:hypothetical protein
VEQSGRNRQQPVAKRPTAITAQTSHFATVGSPRNGSGLDGKEGVDGSSPSEGFTESPAKPLLELSHWETVVRAGSRGRYLVFPR